MKEYLKRIYPKDKESYYKLISKDLKSENKRFIVTVNPETLMLAEGDDVLRNLLLEETTSLTPDGIAVVKACKKLGFEVKERITGIEIAEFLLKVANENGYSLYLFGAREDVIKLLVDKINREYPKVELLGYSNGYVENKDRVMEDIIKLKTDICMVALGIPEQEKIIYKYIEKAKKGVFIGVGGSFDVMSGSKKRAPRIFIKLNLEWLYRIIKEPSRIKRFWNNNVKFLFKVKKN